MSTSKKPTILCVDDNVDTLDLLELYLYRDFEVHTAANGFEGMKTAGDLRPSLVVTDIMMPVADGIRLFNDMRKFQPTSTIPVIAMTSFLKKITRKSLLNMGFNGVITKPVVREKLLCAIARILEIPELACQQQVTDETQT